MLFSSLVQRLARRSKRKTEDRQRRCNFRNGSRRLSMETLEHRSMLSAGGLNPHFGTGGKTLINFGAGALLAGGYEPVPTFAVTPDGMTVLAGIVSLNSVQNQSIAVAELTKDGNLNSHFGAGGETIISLPGGPLNAIGYPPSLAVQPDGTIVLVAPERFLTTVVELNKDGSPKSSFGSSGVAIVSLSTAKNSNVPPYYLSDLFPSNFVVKPDGEIVLYAQTYTYDPATDTNALGIMVAELTNNGNLNTHFGSGGETSFAGNIFGANTAFGPDYSNNNGMAPWNPLAITGNGTIVLTGNVNDPTDSRFDVGIGVVELTKDGNLNNHFGQGGAVYVPSSIFGLNLDTIQFTNSIVNPDGTILLGGNPYDSSNSNISVFGVAELNRDGSLNANFGVGGEATVNVGANYPVYITTNIALGPCGAIVVGGTVTNLSTGQNEFAVAELTQSGHLKTDFGANGITIASFGANYSISIFLSNIVVQPDGAIVVATTLTDVTTGQTDFAVAELTNDGKLNDDFGVGGETIVDFGPGNSINSSTPSYVLVEPDGTILMAGNVLVPGSYNEVSAWAVAVLSGNHTEWAEGFTSAEGSPGPWQN